MKPKPQKILYLIGRGALGGVERHVQAILRHLDRECFDPSLAVLMEDGVVSREIAKSGVPTYVLGATSGSDPRAAYRFYRLMKRLKPDIVHAHELHMASGLALRLQPTIKWIQTEHCAFDHGPSPAKARFLWRIFNGGMHSILAVSGATGDSLSHNVNLPRNRVRTIFNGVDQSLIVPKRPEILRQELQLPVDAIVVGAVGRMARQKGWDDFLLVADRLMAENPRIHLVLIGDGPEFERIRQALDQRDWIARSHFLGRREDAVALIGGMDLFLLTSIHEELPTTLLEAFAMRTPVAGFLPEGGVSEIMQMTSCPPAKLLENRNIDALARAIEELLCDTNRTMAMIDSATAVLKHFSMDLITRQLESEYARVLADEAK